ncbi:MAG: M48 family metalloprotease [Candidatus Acidiferrales bacterium]
MEFWKKSLSIAALVAVVPIWTAAQDTQQSETQAPASALDQIIDHVAAQEQHEVQMLRRYNPIVETYIQDMKPDRELGMVPAKDHYFLSVADLSKGVSERSMVDKQKKSGKFSKLNPLNMGGLLSSDYIPEGFLEMIYVDPAGFNRQNYNFDYVRREFLGEVRCFVFDVTPKPHSGKGRFLGRIWVEDQGYNVVRFNGVFTPQVNTFTLNLHFDSWRQNVAPNIWVPSYVFSEESDLRDALFTHVRFKAQTRLWGYNVRGGSHEEEFSELKVESPTIQDQSPAASTDSSPLQSERQWQHEAEQNVVDKLQRSGLIAPPGEVDKVMDTVVNNLEVTNNLDIQPEIHCRVLLTTTLESFSIGHTIVISRGLLDVLPDEASLAVILAHEMGHVMLGQPLDDRYAFNDQTLFATQDAFRALTFRSNEHDEAAATAKSLELLKNSPYKDKLATAGLFMKQLDAEQKALPALISGHLGSRVSVNTQIEQAAPAPDAKKLDQVAALPLGSRVKLDPWNDRLELVKSKTPVILSEREKMPFEVAPFFPYLTRYATPAATSPASTEPAKADVAKKDPQSN